MNYKTKNVTYFIIWIISIIYIIYCITFDGSYIKYGKNIGWQSRNVAPLSYWFNIIGTSLIPIGLLVYNMKSIKKYLIN